MKKSFVLLATLALLGFSSQVHAASSPETFLDQPHITAQSLHAFLTSPATLKSSRISSRALTASVSNAASTTDATLNSPLTSEEIVGLTQPSIVKVVENLTGSVGIPNFKLNYQNLTVIPPKSSKDIIELPIEQVTGSNIVYGSGFVISPDGTVVTNAHVVDGLLNSVYDAVIQSYIDNISDASWNAIVARYPSESDAYTAISDSIYAYLTANSQNVLTKNIVVLRPNSQSTQLSDAIDGGYKATVLYDNANYVSDGKDIAVLKIDQTNLPALALGDNTSVKEGQSIFTFGFPSSADFNEQDLVKPTLSQGSIDSIKQDKGITIYQTDAKVSEGSSGSPILNSSGKVIGILTYGTNGTSGDNFGFAIPVSILKDTLTAQNIKPSSIGYYDDFSKGLLLLSQMHCKQSIASFQSATTGLNPDFAGTDYTKSPIESCNSIIASGKSIDSIWDSIRIFVMANIIVLSISIVVVIIVAAFIVFMVLKMKKDEDAIHKLVAEKEAAAPVAPATPVQPAQPAPVAAPVPVAPMPEPVMPPPAPAPVEMPPVVAPEPVLPVNPNPTPAPDAAVPPPAQ